MNKLLLEQAIIEYRIKHILDTPHLKAKYLAEYKRETGSKVLDEGFKDWLKSTFGKAKEAGRSAVDTVKNKSKEAATKVSNVAKGLVDMGFGIKGATILAGAETFDFEKRKQMIGQAETALNSEIKQLKQVYYKYVQDTTINGGKDLEELNKSLIEKEFPNSKTFEQDVKQIKTVYLQFVQRYENKEVKAKLTNLTIAVLRHLVIFYQDYKVYDKNLYMNEQQRKELKALIREQTDVIKNSGEDEDYSKIKGRKQGDVSASYESAYSAKLPTALLIGGATLAALGIGANSDTFQNILERLKDMGEATDAVPEEISKIIIGKGQGITQVMQTMSGINLGPNQPVSALSSKGLELLKPVIRAAIVAKNGDQGGKAFDQVMYLAGEGSNKTIGQVLQGQYAGTGKKVTDLLDVDAGAFSEVIKPKVDAIAAKPLDTVKNTLLKWMGNYAGPIMQGLGLALAAGGVASAALRTKGKLSSRMSTLKNLVDTFVDVGEKEEEGEGGGQPPVPPPEPPQPPPEPPVPPPTPGPTPGPTPPPEPPPVEPEKRKRKKKEGGKRKVVINFNTPIDEMALKLLGVRDQFERNPEGSKQRAGKIGPNPNGSEEEKELNRKFNSLKRQLGNLLYKLIKKEFPETKLQTVISERFLKEYSPDNTNPVVDETNTIKDFILKAIGRDKMPQQIGSEQEVKDYKEISTKIKRIRDRFLKAIRTLPEFADLEITAVSKKKVDKAVMEEHQIIRWKQLAGIIKG